MYDYTPVGVCSKKISVEIDENNKITYCKFTGGCSGNTQGLSKMVIGKDANEVIEILRGIQCGARLTSCPDQLAQALDDCILMKSL